MGWGWGEERTIWLYIKIWHRKAKLPIHSSLDKNKNITKRSFQFVAKKLLLHSFIIVICRDISGCFLVSECLFRMKSIIRMCMNFNNRPCNFIFLSSSQMQHGRGVGEEMLFLANCSGFQCKTIEKISVELSAIAACFEDGNFRLRS